MVKAQYKSSKLLEIKLQSRQQLGMEEKLKIFIVLWAVFIVS
jgi:hypothetical protein